MTMAAEGEETILGAVIFRRPHLVVKDDAPCGCRPEHLTQTLED